MGVFCLFVCFPFSFGVCWAFFVAGVAPPPPIQFPWTDGLGQRPASTRRCPRATPATSPHRIQGVLRAGGRDGHLPPWKSLGIPRARRSGKRRKVAPSSQAPPRCPQPRPPRRGEHRHGVATARRKARGSGSARHQRLSLRGAPGSRPMPGEPCATRPLPALRGAPPGAAPLAGKVSLRQHHPGRGARGAQRTPRAPGRGLPPAGTAEPGRGGGGRSAGGAGPPLGAGAAGGSPPAGRRLVSPVSGGRARRGEGGRRAAGGVGGRRLLAPAEFTPDGGREVSDGDRDGAWLGSAPLHGGFCGRGFAPVGAVNGGESAGAGVAGGERRALPGESPAGWEGGGVSWENLTPGRVPVRRRGTAAARTSHVSVPGDEARGRGKAAGRGRADPRRPAAAFGFSSPAAGLPAGSGAEPAPEGKRLRPETGLAEAGSAPAGAGPVAGSRLAAPPRAEGARRGKLCAEPGRARCRGAAGSSWGCCCTSCWAAARRSSSAAARTFASARRRPRR